MPDIHPVLLKWTITLKDTILRVFAVRVLKLRKDAKPFIFFVGFFGVLFLLGGRGREKLLEICADTECGAQSLPILCKKGAFLMKQVYTSFR